jgi:TrpR family trp operon transcriptional repressor
MTKAPEFDNWSCVTDLVKQAVKDDQHEMLLAMMLTADEREALVSRANILYELLQGDLSQRQISQMLGVGVATITRGSNELKSRSDQERQALFELLKAQIGSK